MYVSADENGLVSDSLDVNQLNFERKNLMGSLIEYIENLTTLQEKMFQKFVHYEFHNDGFYDFTSFNKQISLCQYFSDSLSYTSSQKFCSRWSQLYSKLLKLKSKYQQYFVPIPKLLAAILILEGQYLKAVTILCEAVQLHPIDMNTWFALLWWVTFLQDWNALGILLSREENIMKDVVRSDGYSAFIDCCQLVFKMHSSENATGEISKIVQKFNQICSDDKRTYLYYFCKILLRNALVHASRMPYANLNEIGDPLYNRSSALDVCSMILQSRLPQFAKQEESISVFLLQRINQFDDFMLADEFLRIFLSVADYFELSHTCASEMLEVGLVREAHAFCVTAWKHAFLFSIPLRIIVSLGDLIFEKSVTVLDKNNLSDYASCLNALLTPTCALIKHAHTPDTTKRKKIDCDSLLIEVTNKLQQSLNVSDDDEKPKKSKNSLIQHNAACNCVFCQMLNAKENPSNWRFSLFIGWISFLLSGFDHSEFEQFRRKCRLVRPVVLAERKALCVNATKMEAFITPYFSELWVQAITSTLTYENVLNLSDSLKKTYTNEALQLCNFAPFRFRPNLLLFELLQRESLFYSKNLLVSTEIPLTAYLAAVKNSSSLDEDIYEAYMCQKKYGHLFLREWRQRSCLFLSRNLEQIKHKAYYLLEAAVPSVRQYARISQYEKFKTLTDLDEVDEKENFFFCDTTAFTKFIYNLPKDITIINLIVDTFNVLWLVRCHFAHDPIVLPIKKISKDDDILKRMRDVLDENNESLNSKPLEAIAFWKQRRKLDADIKDFLTDWQAAWFGDMALFLTPSAYVSKSELKNLCKIERKFQKTFGFSQELAMTLVRICDHALRQDWEALMRHITADNSAKSQLPSILKYYDVIRTNLTKAKKYTILVVPPTLDLNMLFYLAIKFPAMGVSTNFRKCSARLKNSLRALFQLLSEQLKSCKIPKEVDGRNSYYVLNPGGDLSNTEKRISAFMEKYKWNGVVGKVPSRAEIKNVLAAHDMFLYLGHGSGRRYFGRSYIRHCDCRAVSVLMGCSSGCIQDLGPTFDGKTIIYEYLIARCPCLVGCLWTVTDGEIDRFFMALMEYCFNKSTCDSKSISSNSSDKLVKLTSNSILTTPTQSRSSARQQKDNIEKTSNNEIAIDKENVIPSSSSLDDYRILVEGVVEARNSCKLPYLTGSSVVSYGLPIASRFSTTDSTAVSQTILIEDSD